MTTDAELWLQATVPCADPGRRLVCFAHAGGSASFFRDWGNHLPGTQVLAVNYPGRAGRIAEPLPTDLRQLAREIADAVRTLDERPLVLFGHSLGGVVALETARCLEEDGVKPAHLFASGSCDAPLPDPVKFTDADDGALSGRLVGLGGTDPELADDPFFQELVLPYIRADGRMFHAYAHRREPLLHCPVTTIAGDADADADRRPWRELTTGGFREHVVRGDHFYLIPNPPFALLQASLVASG